MRLSIVIVLLAILSNVSCKLKTKSEPIKSINSQTLVLTDTLYKPRTISRNIVEDRNGQMWVAAFDGVWRYDGKAFTNVIAKVSSARFFSVMEDSKGRMWFGSIGAGVYVYDGKEFNRFSTTNGLLNNEVTCIFEDNIGQIWFGVNGGMSCYDGTSFKNYTINGETMNLDIPGITLQDVRPPNEVTSMVQDSEGKYWVSTRGNTYIFDGKVFTSVMYDVDTPFSNVRTLINDSKGYIWFSGNDGLWRYRNQTFEQVTNLFTGYVYEDSKGNIWTSSEEEIGGKWALTRYDVQTLASPTPKGVIIKSGEGMIFGISEDRAGRIWYGTMNGVKIIH